MNAPLTWTPTPETLAAARMSRFLRETAAETGLPLRTYRDLHAWSVTDPGAFWDALRRHLDVLGEGFEGPVLPDDAMPGTRWFPAARLNYAENVLRPAADPSTAASTAITEVTEDGDVRELSWETLAGQVAGLATSLRRLGVGPGDRVAAMLPNVPEAIVGLLAASSLGAVWSICSPDLAVEAITARLGQLEPKVLIGVEGYRFKGQWFDRTAELAAVRHAMPSVEATIVVRPFGGADRAPTGDGDALHFADLASIPAAPDYARLPFDHPLWVLFSSGTTGAPKGIVHGQGGMLLEGQKMFAFHHDLGPGDVYYVAANTSWMVWNTLLHVLSVGARVVCYAGPPQHGGADRQLRIVAEHGVTAFATGAAYLTLLERSGAHPKDELDFSALRTISSTGSPLPDSTWQWVHDAVRRDVHLGSESGGTDVCAALIGSNPLEPVHLGRLQGPLLGVDAQAWDEEGRRVRDEVGELVITRPTPAMPVRFWNDDDGGRLRAAYFERFPGVWTHGDWVTELSTGEYIVHGRSDATLNRGGVRLGSAEIYSALGHVPEVADALVLGVELDDGGYLMPLFVSLAEGVALDEDLTARIADAIRAGASARHVPDEVHAVPAIPVNFAGKKLEVPLKRLFRDPEAGIAVDRGTVSNPESVDWFVDFARAVRARGTGGTPPHRHV